MRKESTNLLSRKWPPTAKAITAVLTVLLALAFLLRSCGLSHDLDQGNVYHPDTPKQIYAVQRFLEGEYQFKTGNINYDGYPFFNSRLIELSVRAFLKTGNLFRAHIGIDKPMPVPDSLTLFLLTRMLNVLFSTATVLLAFLIARRIFCNAAAMAAAALTAISPLAVITCHDAMSDSTAIFFAVSAVYFAVRIFQKGAWSDYLFAGLAIAFSFSAKYHGAIALLPCLLAHAMRQRTIKRIFQKSSLMRLALLGGAGLAGFIFATPAFMAEPLVTIGNIITFFRYTSNFGMRPELKALSLPARWWFGLTHNLPDFYKLLSPPIFLLLIPWTVYELCGLRRRPGTALIASVPLLYIFVAVPFKPLTHPQYHGMAIALLFVLAGGALADMWRAGKSCITARIATLSAMTIAVYLLAVQTHEANFYYQCRDTRLIADYWLKDNVPASFQIAAGHYTLTYTPPEVANPRGRVMLSSNFRPHRPPVKTALKTRIDLKDNSYELFRNPVITTYVHDSAWLSGRPRPPVYLAVATPHSRYPILTETDSLLRTPRVFDLAPGVNEHRVIFSKQKLDEIIVVHRNADSQSDLVLDIGKDKRKFKMAPFESGFTICKPRRKALRARPNRYVYEVDVKSANSFCDLRLAISEENKGAALFQIGRFRECLPYLQSACAKAPSPTLAAMIVDAADAGGNTIKIREETKQMADIFHKTGWNSRKLLEHYKIAPEYLESLPYLELGIDDMHKIEDGLLQSRIIFLPPGVYSVQTAGINQSAAHEIEIRDERTGKDLMLTGKLFETDCDTFAFRIKIEGAVEEGPKISIRPSILPSIQRLTRISHRITATPHISHSSGGNN